MQMLVKPSMRAVAVALILLGVGACSETQNWTLFYYPDATELPNRPLETQDITGYYATFEQCQAKALGLRKLNEHHKGAYQCGHLCELNDASQLTCQSVSQ